MDNELLKKWEDEYRHRGINPELISIDGKLNFEKYNPEAGVVFVLKDTNSDKRVNLADLLKEGPKYQMWHAVGRWAAGILNGFPEYPQINSYEAMKEALHQVAVVNLKKKTGGSSVHSSTISAYAHMDQELLKEQFRSLKPRLIVACGTFEQLIWLLNLECDPARIWEAKAYSREMDCPVIPWIHPSRSHNVSSYNELKNIVLHG